MNSVEETVIDRLELIRETSFVLANEFLFCILYYLCDLNRPVSLTKLSKDLGADKSLIADHLGLLVNNRLLISESGKFGISERGKAAVQMAEEGAGKRPYVYTSVASAPAYAEVRVDFNDASSTESAFCLYLNISMQDLRSTDRTEIDRVQTEKKSPSAQESEMFRLDEESDGNRLIRHYSENAQTDATIV
jgi:hypothetical protein